ncbi:hypothetical protein CGLO_11258 [Colletotrichum gloeosporioides Cg-14]|uniref:BZIP transcription factor n=1 Tax=Colletotrichum gloeosporioides (strain Cg-14) TaxID=1237896 RepID=T0K1B3_COLGC|nr:hypothetical protein CGLO_11258 [Colletotrichum gloeosporioides Cg-14]
MASTPGTAPTPDVRHHGTGSSATVSSSRLKKREADRKAQRIAREKTKNRIAHLEGLVAELSRKEDNATTVALMTQLAKVTEQRNRLMSCMEGASASFVRHLAEVKEGEEGKEDEGGGDGVSLLEPTRMEYLSTPAAVPIPTTPQDHIDERQPHHLEKDMNSLVDASALDVSNFWIDESFPVDLPTAHSLPKLPSPAPPPAAPSTIKVPVKSECSCTSNSRTRRLSDGSLVSHNCWKASNEILKEPLPPDQGDARARVPGRMTPLWKKVRQLDELCFAGCGSPERLAVLFMIHLLMRAYTDPTPAKSEVVPRWYLKSQLQQLSPEHDPSADYFTWPALRYRFATTPHPYCHNNTFWHMFREHLRIAWPFDFRDCYVRNVHRGTYALSPLFKDRLRDLRAWTMEPDFFAQYPELRQDVPQYPGQPSPGPLCVLNGGVGALMQSGGVPSAEEKEEEEESGKGGRGRGDEDEGEMFMGDLGIETNPEFLLFQDAFLNGSTAKEYGVQLSRHKDSSCISL